MRLSTTPRPSVCVSQCASLSERPSVCVPQCASLSVRLLLTMVCQLAPSSFVPPLPSLPFPSLLAIHLASFLFLLFFPFSPFHFSFSFRHLASFLFLLFLPFRFLVSFRRGVVQSGSFLRSTPFRLSESFSSVLPLHSIPFFHFIFQSVHFSFDPPFHSVSAAGGEGGGGGGGRGGGGINSLSLAFVSSSL